MTFIKGQIPWNKNKNYHSKNKGRKLTEEHRKALMVPHKGAGIYPRTEYHKEICRRSTQKMYDDGKIFGFRKSHYKNSGEKNNNWKGGITPANEKIRKSVQYKIWQFAVFSRDNWTCVFCGKRGGDLDADHIKMFAFHPELRFAIDNGRTLCKECHRKTPTYSNHMHICCLLD